MAVAGQAPGRGQAHRQAEHGVRAVQVVWHKFARYWDIEIREVPMAHGQYFMTPEDVLERVDENTIMVVPTLGSPTPAPTRW